MIDGAGRFKQVIHVTLPCITPTIVILLILRIGHLLSVGYEKTILLYNPATYETADIISTYVYRVGLLEQNWSYSTAIGLFNSAINFALLIMANRISRKLSETSLW
jgi:putative aldouronate transport system permease protein